MKYKKGDKGKPDKDRKKSDIRVGPSYEVAHAAAAVVIRVLKDMGMTAAVFGSIAYKLYGSTRNPNNANVLVWSPNNKAVDLNTLRTQIAEKEPSVFFAVSSSQSWSTQLVLWYRESPQDKTTHCRVDIILPSIIGLPNISSDCPTLMDGLAVVPFSVALLQALQAWNFGIESGKIDGDRHFRQVRDVEAMLKSSHIPSLRVERPWKDVALFDEAYQKATRSRLQRFCAQYPNYVEEWRLLGFPLVQKQK